MAPKRNARDVTPTPAAAPTTVAPKPSKSTSKTSGGAQSWDRVIVNVYNYYQSHTPQRTKLIDVFMAFLVLTGGVQFLYCIMGGNYVRCGRNRASTEFVQWRLTRRHSL